MARIEMFGPSAYDPDNPRANPQRLINFYREPVQEGGATNYILKSVLGGQNYAGVDAVLVQAMATLDRAMWLICGGDLFRIAAPGIATPIASVGFDAETGISSNNGNVVITSQGRYRVWDGTSLSEPAPGAFDAFGSVEFLGEYTILTERDGRRFQWSGVADAKTLPALNFATAEATDEPLVRAVAINGLLWLFKASSVEIWGQVPGGFGANAFAPLGGGVRETGLRGFNLICRFPDGAFFVGSDGRAHITSAGETRPISTPAVETAIKTGQLARCLFYEDEGHAMVCITFRDRPAWCYDVATNEWHERAEGLGLPWTAAASARLGGAWYVGTDSGAVLQLSRGNTDAGGPLIRQATSRMIVPARRFRVPLIEFFTRFGQTAAELPALMVSTSRDGGATFGPERVLPLGAQGQYLTRAELRNLGMFERGMVARVRIASPAEVPLFCDADVVFA